MSLFYNDTGVIPVAFQVATLLAALAHPNHLLLVGSWGFTRLPPRSNLKSFGYINENLLRNSVQHFFDDARDDLFIEFNRLSRVLAV